MSGRLDLTFLRSATSTDQLPASPAEVAFVGRSNVGKSSLVNALANRKALAKVSNTPGRTQLINVYATASGSTLVDLPGYGFAAVPTRVRKGWQPMIERYLLERDALVQQFVLVDAEIGPTTLDVAMLAWSRANEIPHTIVATKTDKVRSSKRQTRKRELAAACDLEVDDIVWVSVASGEQIAHLRSLVLGHLTPTG